MQQERDTSSHEKAKRQLKTPAQVEALEKFYHEHKYPTEAMKLEFAMKIGLSEKQVSGWFCHRRLKEKKISQGETYPNGKQNLSSSAIHDRTSGVKQESCSSTKQVDRNLDSKEVESKLYHGYRSSSDVLTCETRNKHARVGHKHVAEDRSSGGSASQGSYLQSNENLCIAQLPKYKLRDDSSILMSNKNTDIKSKEHTANSKHSFLQDENDTRGIKSKEHMVNSRQSFLQDEIDTRAISALKWKLGRHYREDGPPLGFDFDPLPPGAFDSPVRDSKCEPYYVGDSIQHESSSFCMSINEPRVYDKYNIEKLANKAYQEQRSFKTTKPGLIDCNEIAYLQSTQNTFTKHHYHVQYQAIAIDETEKSMNRTSCFDDRNNLGCFKYKTEGGYDSKAGYNLHQNCQSSNVKNSFPYPNYDTQVLPGEYFYTKSFREAQKKYDSIGSEYLHQRQKLLKDNIMMESTKKYHSTFQPEMLMKNKTGTAGNVNDVEFWQQQCAGKVLEKPARQVPFIRHPWNMESNLHQDVSGDTSSSLD